MSFLPKVPTNLRSQSKDYLVELVRQLERELRRRPREQSDGVVYMGLGNPYTFIDDAGNQYELGVDVLPPGIGTSDLAANGGTIPETDRTNEFSSKQVLFGGTAFNYAFGTGPVFQMGGPIDSAVGEGFVGTVVGTSSELRTYVQGGHGRVHLAWNGYWDNNSSTWRSLKASEAHSIIGIGGVTPGADNGGNIFIGAAVANSSAGDPVTFNGMYVQSDGGAVVGTPTGGSQGAGTLNAQAVYDDGSLLTDYVFDGEIDQQIDTEFYDRAVPDREIKDENGKVLRAEKRVHTPARQFSQNMDELDPKGFEQKWRSSRKLPAMARAPEKPSLGEYAQALLETCEVQAVHIAKLEARISALEAKSS